AQPGRGGGPGSRRERNFQGKDWAILLESEENSAPMLTRRMTVFRRFDRLYRRSAETHRLRLYNGEELARILPRIGYRTRLTRHFGRYALPAGMVGVISRKVSSS